MTLSTDTLVTAVRRRCFWPATGPLSDADIVSLAEEEIRGRLWQQMLAAQADYYVSTLDYTITLNQTLYRLPAKAFGPIRDLLQVELDGTEVSMPTFDLEDVGRPDRIRRSFRSTYMACVDGDYLRLTPTPNVTDGRLLRIRYFHAPSALVVNALGATILSRATVFPFGVPTDRLTLASNVTGFWVGTTNADVVSAGNAHQIIKENVTQAGAPTTIADVNLNTYPSGWGDAQVNDYFAMTGQTPIVQLPDLMESLLVRRVAAACLTANGEIESAGREEGEAERLAVLASDTLKPRMQAEPSYVVTRNSPMRRGIW